MKSEQTIRVMFVCAGNICRSPMAEAVFRHLVADAGLASRFEVASSGTGGWHVGEKPHPGTQAVLQRRQVPLGDKRAQRLTRAHVEYYPYLIAMDEENMMDIRRMYGVRNGQLRRLLEFAPRGAPLDVPDPYYTGGFDQVYELVAAGCLGLLDHIREREQI